MLTKRQRKVLIDKIEKLPAQVKKAVRGAGKKELATTYREGGWTVRQVVHHLLDSHINAYCRMRLTLTEEGPTVRPYDEKAWAELPDAAAGPLKPSLKALEGLHARWAALLRAVPEEMWARPAHHPDYGATSLEGLLVTYSAHGENHLGHIKLGRKRYSKG